jgi:hypothetical protein
VTTYKHSGPYTVWTNAGGVESYIGQRNWFESALALAGNKGYVCDAAGVCVASNVDGSRYGVADSWTAAVLSAGPL